MISVLTFFMSFGSVPSLRLITLYWSTVNISFVPKKSPEKYIAEIV